MVEERGSYRNFLGIRENTIGAWEALAGAIEVRIEYCSTVFLFTPLIQAGFIPFSLLGSKLLCIMHDDVGTTG